MEVMGGKEMQENCHRLEDTKETGQLNAMCDSGSVKDISGKLVKFK